ncbi:cellulase family glycosylhydrolase [Mycolicibacterium elephantis]|uniref:cellulase family glycosylhydrolase n=1 Tax=Mycolicibacterium elephantis TaxID=81858 RepID=UPI0007EB3736|nr:cellulase family glycosylhydrolase [Mycolicibacterium elephantis]OBB20622.1 hypothetical protein A5762_15310 [Mycolicibacterium elephantis]
MTLTLGIGQSELPWGDSFASADKVAQDIAEIAELGATAIRMSCIWQYVEPNLNGKYVWGALDRAIDAAEAAGLDILLIIEPRRANVYALFGLPIASSVDPVKYGRLCKAIAQRYAGRIAYFEIGNEVNNRAFFAGGADDYADLLREAYQGIKPHAPDSLVLAGALMAVDTGNAFGFVKASDHPVEWTRQFYRSNPQEWFDGLSFHGYSTGGRFNPLAPTPDNEFAFGNITKLRKLMDDNGDSSKPLVNSEWGYDSVRTLNGLSTTADELEAEAAANLETHWNLLEPYADAGIIYPTTWVYNYRDQKDDDEAYGFGQVRTDRTRKLSWFFLRSLAIDQAVEVAAAAATATGSPVEVEEFIDPASPKAAPAAATAQAWPVVVAEAITAEAAAAAAAGWPVDVTERSVAVEYVSAGAGDRDTSGGGGTHTIDWTHTVTDAAGRMLLVGLVVSTSNLRGWENYIPTVSSDLGGAFIRLGSRHIGSASVRHGSVHIYGLYHPPLGEHTITASLTDAFADFTSFAGNSVQVRGAADYGQIAAAGSSSGGNTPRITVSSMLENLVFGVFGSTDDLPNLTGDIRHAAGSVVSGDGDFITIATKAGASSVVLEDTTTGLQIFGALGLNIPRMTGTQKAITASAAAAAAQGWPATVAAAEGVDVAAATATAAGLDVTVAESVAAEAATATAQGLSVELTEVVAVESATATATGLEVAVSEGADVPVDPASATAEGHGVVVGELVSAESATATAQGHPATVEQDVGIAAATATAVGLAVDVAETVVVELDAVGAGNRATGSTSTLSVDLEHTVGEGADYLVVAVCGSWSSSSSTWETLTTFSATSDVDGALTPLTTANVGTQDLGAVRLFGLANPTAGAHTITVTTAKAGTTFSSLMGQTLSYSGVGGTSGANTVSNFSAALDLHISSAADSVVVFVGGFSGDRSSSFSGGTVRYNNGGSVGGAGDFAIVADAAGAATVTFSADSGVQNGGVGISLNPPA